MRCCDSCKHMGDREWFEIPPNGGIPAVPVRQGRCYALPPKSESFTQSYFPPINLFQRCGLHAFSAAGFWRSLKRLVTGGR